ncbi:MAG TPA: DUF4838 domain-containing protein [Chthonomonadaceae bacterium]|nr:DUF4838 domain-containing protein [Chthonomonadaceae bacterium]
MAAFFQTRGVVLTPEDLSWDAWPDRAAAVGLTTIALHPTPGRVAVFVESEGGQRFLTRCHALGLQVEYELHAIGELLPRSLFEKDPALFPMNEQGARMRDCNLCVHSETALQIAAENAVKIARLLRPTTGRYFFWGDDGAPWCRCPRCRSLSDSDQALLFENALIKALRREDPQARLAHLAYANTLQPPTQIEPEAGVFLEFAPIRRRYDMPYAEQVGPGFDDTLNALDANLAVFGAQDAQALEYWLDVSRFSHWQKPPVRIPWNSDLFAADLDSYAARDVRHITTFAVQIDADYLALYGEPPLDEYGKLLA